MTEHTFLHGKQTFVVHAYVLAAGPGDDAFDTVAMVGPFATVEAAGVALKAQGWESYDLGPTEWHAPMNRRRLRASISEVEGRLPSD